LNQYNNLNQNLVQNINADKNQNIEQSDNLAYKNSLMMMNSLVKNNSSSSVGIVSPQKQEEFMDSKIKEFPEQSSGSQKLSLIPNDS
jgi:hypothetical protein